MNILKVITLGKGDRRSDVFYSLCLSAFQFVIEGVFGETDKTDIAVDAVCITSCTGKNIACQFRRKI